MNIFINDEPINFSLENEKNVKEIFNELERWLHGNNFFISEIYLDSEEVYLTRIEDWGNKNVDKVKEISIKAITSYEKRHQSLQVLYQYFEQFIKSLQMDDNEIIDQYQSEFTYIHESLTGLLGDGKDKTIADNLQKTFLESFVDGKLVSANKQKIISDFSGLLTILDARIREIENPIREAESSYQEILRISKQFPEISLYLQTGKDNQAMAIIILLTEYLQKIIRIIVFHPAVEILKKNNEDDLRDFFEKMNELLEAFESEDTILIGDLIEYEIMDYIEKIPDMIEILKKG